MFDRSFNGSSFDAHDGPVRCCRAVPLSNDCQSCRTRDKWWEGDDCVDRTERVQLQTHAKLVAIQTEACPAVRSTQPDNALHALLYTIHTVSRWNHRCNCLDCHEFSSTPLRFRPHPRMSMQLSFRPPSHAAAAARALCSFHHSPCMLQLSDSRTVTVGHESTVASRPLLLVRRGTLANTGQSSEGAETRLSAAQHAACPAAAGRGDGSRRRWVVARTHHITAVTVVRYAGPANASDGGDQSPGRGLFAARPHRCHVP